MIISLRGSWHLDTIRIHSFTLCLTFIELHSLFTRLMSKLRHEVTKKHLLVANIEYNEHTCYELLYTLFLPFFFLSSFLKIKVCYVSNTTSFKDHWQVYAKIRTEGGDDTKRIVRDPRVMSPSPTSYESSFFSRRELQVTCITFKTKMNEEGGGSL